MPIEVKQLSGNMDSDSPNEGIPASSVRSAWDVVWKGPLGNMRPESNPGTTLVPNSLLPSGINKTLNAHYDAVNKRIIFFNYNSNGSHGILVYNTLVSTFQIVVQNGINTVGDVLGFTPDRISNVDILYGDGDSGDLLFWIDTLKRPRKLNLTRLLAGGGPPVKSVFFDVAKAPPVPPPQCVYENDPTVTNNNLINSLFNFSCTHIYDDFEQSVLGSGAKQPLPPDPFDPQNNTDKTRCARIAIYVPTGDSNVTKIRIYGKQTKDGKTTDWFVIDTLIKADLGIANNTVYKYLFFNNGNYVPADPTFTVLDYDVVPQSANAQCLLNGNVIAYGAITEGYDFFNPAFSIVTSNGNEPAYSINGTLFFGSYNGIFTGNQPQITFYLTGVGVNDGFNNPITLEKAPNILTVIAQSNSSAIGVVYVNTGLTNSIATILSELSTQLQSIGWVLVGSDTNSLTMYYPTGNIVFQGASLNSEATDTSPYLSAVSCHYPESAYAYGVVYRDVSGRTNGVISNVTGNIKTQTRGSDNQIPIITISLIGFAPPIWAAYYEVVRTDTLTYQKYFDWVSAGAYQGLGQGVNTLYAYFDVSNISTYNTSISATEGVISYSFSQGDRIRVLGRYDANGNFTALNLDYAIVGSPTEIIANGVAKAGQFVQINYPTADVAANPSFQFTTVTNDTNFQNYSILIYSYKALSADNQNVYFQIGQQYGIGNAGTSFAYHMGNDPASLNVVVLSDGDTFYRQRNVPIQSSYFINTGSFDQTSPYGTDWINPGGGATPIVDNGIWKIVGGVQKVAGLLSTQYPTYSDNDFTILNESTTQTLTVRLRGTQTIVDKTDPNGQYEKFVKIVQPGNIVTIIQIVPLQTGMQPGVPVTVTFDRTIPLPPQGKLWLINHCINEMLIGGYLLELDVIRTRTIYVFDSSQSDIYALRTNSDNKPNVINVEAKITFFSTLFRYSEPDQLGTDINNSNRFYPDNFDEFDKRFGSIVRMIQWERRLRIAQERKWGEIGVYSKFIKNNTGQTDLIVNDQIIEPNNIQYFQGDFGIGNQPDCLAINGFQIWFVDPIRMAFCRLSLDGIKVISEECKMQTYANRILYGYLNFHQFPWGGNAVVLGVFNYVKDRDSEAIFCFQTGTGRTFSQSISYIEARNGLGSFYNFAPDSIVCAENTLVSFWNGNLFLHNNTADGQYAQYYGTTHLPSVQIIFNDQVAIKKKYMAIAYQAYINKIWGALAVGDITTSFFDPQSNLQQISQLLAVDFEVNEGGIFAAFLYDANSMENAQLALVQGAYLQGFWLSCKLSAPDNNFNFLYLPFIRWNASPKTP